MDRAYIGITLFVLGFVLGMASVLYMLACKI